jgi:hypothetical protein
MVPDDEFAGMVAHANRFRTDVRELGMSSYDVNANVRARLYWNSTIPELSAAHQELANEILALLHNQRLSASQMAQLEREYFPVRRPA